MEQKKGTQKLTWGFEGCGSSRGIIGRGDVKRLLQRSYYSCTATINGCSSSSTKSRSRSTTNEVYIMIMISKRQVSRGGTITITVTSNKGIIAKGWWQWTVVMIMMLPHHPRLCIRECFKALLNLLRTQPKNTTTSVAGCFSL